MQLDTEKLNQIRMLLCDRYPDLLALYLFGSYANGTATTKSDVDLAILCPTSLEVVSLFDTAQDIARQLDTDVDLIDLRAANLVFATQIIAHGQRFYCTAENATEHFESLVFAKYVRLAEMRAPILKEIKKTGRVYERRNHK